MIKLKKFKLKEKVKRIAWKASVSVVVFLMAFSVIDTTFANELFAANANVLFNTRVLNNIGQEGSEVSTVESGQPFYLEINYQYSAAGDGVTYGSGTLQIVKPEKAIFDIEGTRALMKQYPTVFESVRQDDDLIVFSTASNTSINAGTSANLYMKFAYENFETPNGYGKDETFTQMQYTGTLQSSSGVQNIDPIKIPEISVINNAKEAWTVSKKTAEVDGRTYTEKGENFEVVYQISAKPDAGDRYGRLSSDPFTFVDELPTASTGQIDTNTGKMIGYPVNGGVSSVVSVIRNYGEETATTLNENEDYTLERNTDGSIKAIKFKESAFNKSKNAALISDGHLMGTSFAVTVTYPKAAYEIQNNETSFDAYHLVNKVSLTYQPLGTPNALIEKAESDVELGWKDPNANKHDIKVQKQVAVGTNDLIGEKKINDFTKELQDVYYQSEGSNIAFTLYQDKNCTKVATNWNGQIAAGLEQAIDDKGQVTFKELLAGTYYLKETKTINGFNAIGVKEIVIAKDGSIKVDGVALSGDHISIVNETTSDGFGYVAFWKKGTSAASSAGTYLPGVQFTLKQQNGTKTYSATSNAQGLVLFKGIPAGTYVLTEESKADGEFLPLTDTYKVTVIGNQVNYPTINGAQLPKDEQKPYITNTSTKGSLRILKKSSQGGDTIIKGSEFVAYGPYKTEQEAKDSKEEESLRHVIGSAFTDGKAYYALLPGYYMIKETKAPQGYTKDDTTFVQKVEINTTVELTVKNHPLASLVIEKSGRLNLAGVPADQQPIVPLLGAQFTLYTDELCTKIAKNADGNDAIIKDFQISNGIATSAGKPLYIDAGTYYLKETVVPANYKEMGVQKIELKVGVVETVKAINESSTLGRIIINKTDDKTGNPLKGAVFSITGLDENNKNIDLRITSDETGKAISDFIPAGRYQVKEVTTPNGYVTSTYSKEVEVQDNEELTLDISNIPLINYKIKKVDSTDSTITIDAGVIFALYETEADATNNKNQLQTRSVTAPGKVEFTALIPGKTYYYREIATNSEYTINNEVKPFTVPDKSENYEQTVIPEVQNVHKGGLILTKYAYPLGEDENPFKVDGIKIRIYEKTADTFAANQKSSFYTRVTQNGSVSYYEMPAGEYWVEELDLGNHTEFTKFKEFTVKIEPWGGYVKNGVKQALSTAEAYNTYAKGKLSITKTDAEAKGISATFNIYKADDTQLKTPVGSITTSTADGTGTSGFLSHGDYVLVEQSAKASNGYEYIIDKTPHPFTIRANTVTKLSQPIVNELSGNLKILKYERWNENTATAVDFPLAGIEFNVYLKVNDNEKTFVKKVKSTIDGVVVAGLEPGKTYIIEEIQNDDYEQQAPKEVTIVSGTTKEVRFDNIPNKGKLKIVKQDAITKEYLNNATFDVYVKASESDTGTTTIKIDGVDVKVKKVQTGVVTGTAYKSDGKTIDPGVAYTQFLPDGAIVYLNEVQVPNGYVTMSKWSGPYTIKKGELVVANIENFKSATGTGQKVDSFGKGVKGATVGLFATEAQANKVNEILINNQMTLDDLMEILNDENSDKMGLVSKAVSDENGTLTFLDVSKNTTYYALEIAAPPTYVRSDDVYKVTVNENGKLSWNGSDFKLPNNQLGQFQLKKIGTLSNETIALNDVKFNVYHAVKGTDGSYIIDPTRPEPVLTPVTGTINAGASGAFLSGFLEAGMYVVQENQDLSKQPPYIEITNTLYPVEITLNTINMVHFDTPITNVLKYGKFALSKVSAQDPTVKVDATFKLEKKLDNDTYETVGTEIKVGKDKVYVSDFLPTGEYRITEVGVQNGYTLNSTPISFKIVAGKVTGMKDNMIGALDESDYASNPILVKNDQQGSIALIKQGRTLLTDQYAPLSGVTFDLYKNTGDYKKDTSGTALKTTTTTADGAIKFTNVDAGEYWLVEKQHNATNIDNGYVAGAYYKVKVEPGKESTTYLEASPTGSKFISNDSTYGKFSIKKVDQYDSAKGLAGAVFDVFDDTECENLVDTLTTGMDGTAVSKLLPVKMYYIKEKTAPTDYFSKSNVYEVAVEAQKITALGSSITNEMKQSVEIVKKDAKTSNLITDLTNAKFSIYENDKAEGEALQTITPTNNKLVFTNLRPNTTYWIKEVQAPDGYVTSDKLYKVTTNQTGKDAKQIEITNDPYGSILIEKKAQWSLDNSATQKFPLDGATFTLYDKDQKKIATAISTNGVVQFKNLVAGTYFIEETGVPTGFVGVEGKKQVDVIMGEENKAFTGDNAIVNLPNLAKFTFTKTAPDDTPLIHAEFKLQVKADGSYQDVAGYTQITLDDKGAYTSGLLEPGEYRLIETKAEDHFAMMDPIDFTLSEAHFTTVTTIGKTSVVNEAKGDIVLYKYTDSYLYDLAGSATKKPLSGAEFTLFEQDGKTPVKDASGKTYAVLSDAAGKVLWSDVDPGTYKIKETKAPEGFATNNTIYSVTVASGKSTVEIYDPSAKEITNTSVAGRLVVFKVNEKSEPLKGAKFEIYKTTTDGQKGAIVETITTNDDGYAVSSLLPAEAAGTNYIVKEVKAPDGYTLDEQYGKLEKTITVTPLQDVEMIKANASKNGSNYATFTNTAYDDYKNNTIDIKKGIVVNEDTNEMKNEVSALKCLLEESYTTTFALHSFANSYNKLAVKDITVTDTDMQYWYYENSDPNKRKEEAIENDSYTINHVTLYQASMDKGGIIYASVQYQEATDTGTTWKDFVGNTVEVQDGTKTISLNGLNAKRFRVIYKAEDGQLLQPNFKTDGIDFEVTFAKRPSDATKHEIREITNQSTVAYGYLVKDETGTNKYERLVEDSNEVVIKFPRLNDETPYVSIGISVDNLKNSFAPGDRVYYTIKVENNSENNNLEFESPIVSFDLPVGMSLDDFYKGYDTQFLMLLGTQDNAQTIDMKDVDIVISDTNAKVMTGGSYEETKQKTRKVTMTFNNLSLYSKRNENLYIKFAGTLPQLNSATTGLFAPVYLNSAKEILLSAENPYGNSFLPTSDGAVVADKDLDIIVDKTTDAGDGKKYVYNNVEINVTAINHLNIFKQVKGQYNDTFLGSNNIGSTAPNGTIDYKIVLADGNSDQQIQKARIVDILPFKVDSGMKDTSGNTIYYQDTFVNRNNATQAVTERTTTLTKRAIYAGNLVVQDQTGTVIDPSKYTVYYCVSDKATDADIVKEWTKEARETYHAKDELPMLYGSMTDDAWTSSPAHTWTTQLPDDLSTVTAIGVEVDFTASTPLPKEGTLTVNFRMTAPTYATDELAEVQTGLIVNSAMGAVSRLGHTTDTIADADRIENDPVKVRITLPKGSIGDYAFYDINKNGLQDEGDVPVAGLPVKLHVIKQTSDGTQELIKNTTTDQNGYYLFEQLDCNNLIDKNGDVDDPNNYVGNVIYKYWVEFDTPLDESKRYTYVATDRHVGINDKIDSNIETIIENGETSKRNRTETITLQVKTLSDGTLVGEDNLTLDAGFKALGSLGDYVWVDKNRNGIQDGNEPGVANVVVRLYKADETGAIGEAIEETTTDAYGYYVFEQLLADRYVVEFDITDISSGGYSSYQFTTPLQGSDRQADSNASVFSQSTSIARSGVIDFQDRGYDMSIDAGLIYYSALSGYAFEDRNYSDMQDHSVADIALPGTVVELYQVIDGVRQDKPMRTTTVDNTGTYFFDQLIEGEYQVKFIFPEGYEAVEAHIGDDMKDSDVSEELSRNLKEGFTPIIQIAPNSLETHWDAGARRYGSIGDFVWEDANKNGVQDKGETPIGGIPVYLFERFDDGAWGYRAMTTTNEHGYYVFEHLEGSDFTGISYRVVFGFDQTTSITTPLSGSDVEKDSNALAQYIQDWGYPTNAIVLGYGQDDMSWDAGIIHTSGSVGDYVWFDTNRDGLQNEENTGIEDIEVVLEVNLSDNLDDSGWTQLATTKTNAFGYYRFDDLQAGYYRVKFKVSGYTVTLANVGNDEAIDSDGLITNGEWRMSRPFYLEDGGFDMTWDCGLYTGTPEQPGEQPPLKRPGGTGSNTADTTDQRGYWIMLLVCSGFLVIASSQLRKNLKKAN